jgi:hypothetical protein
VTRRMIWAAAAIGAVALGVVLTPLVPSYDLFKLWLAVCILVASSIAGLYYDSKAGRGER